MNAEQRPTSEDELRRAYELVGKMFENMEFSVKPEDTRVLIPLSDVIEELEAIELQSRTGKKVAS